MRVKKAAVRHPVTRCIPGTTVRGRSRRSPPDPPGSGPGRATSCGRPSRPGVATVPGRRTNALESPPAPSTSKQVRRQLTRVVQPTSTAEQRLVQYELDAGKGYPVQERHPAVPRLDEHRRIVLIKVVQTHTPEGTALILATEHKDTAALVMHEDLCGGQQRILVGDQTGPQAQKHVNPLPVRDSVVKSLGHVGHVSHAANRTGSTPCITQKRSGSESSDPWPVTPWWLPPGARTNPTSVADRRKGAEASSRFRRPPRVSPKARRGRAHRRPRCLTRRWGRAGAAPRSCRTAA